jgi:hypothetical protein
MKKLLSIILVLISKLLFAQTEISYNPEWAFVNDNSNGKVSQFFDNDSTSDVILGDDVVGWSGNATREKWIVFEFPESMEVELSAVIMNDGFNQGECKTYLLDLNNQIIPSFVFKGDHYYEGKPVTYNIAPTRVKAFMIERTYPMPTKIRFIGKYKPYIPFTYTPVGKPFEYMNGVVCHPWDFTNGMGDDDLRLKLASAATLFRLYVDGHEIYNEATGEIYLPRLLNKPERDLQVIADKIKSIGGNLIICLQYGIGHTSYPKIIEALAKQFKGQDVIIQGGNEFNRWWKGTADIPNQINLDGFTSPFEATEIMSKCYDLVKAVDPNMKFIVGGLATSSPGYMRGMILARKILFNNKKCWDGFSYHDYSNENGQQNSAGVKDPLGVAPELGGVYNRAINISKNVREFGGETEIYVTEGGYSVSTVNKSYTAVPTPTKDIYHVQADWIIRTMLTYARSGINGFTVYRLYMDENYKWNPTGYISWDYTCGIVDPYMKPYVANYYMRQAKLLTGYVWKETISQMPLVDRFEKDGKSIYSLVMPTHSDATATYNFGSYTTKIYSFQDTGDTLKITSGTGTISVSETPVFVEISSMIALPIKDKPGKGRGKPVKGSATIYPNPTTNILNFDKPREYVMMDANGIELSRGKSKQISTNKLANGLYILRYKNELSGRYEYLKFIKH